MYTLVIMQLGLRSHVTPIRVNLHAAIASRIGSLIVQGKVAPGSTLPNEASLGAQLGVSRTALREAIKVLASKGLVHVRRKTGTRVNAQASWNMLDPEVLNWMFSGHAAASGLTDLMEVRMLIEPPAARMAAGRATAEDISDIRSSLEGMENSTANLPSSVEADLRFHMAILEATHNTFMRPFGALIEAALSGSFRLTSSNADLYRLTLSLHRQVLEAIERRDEEKAERAMAALLMQTMRDIDQQSKANPPARKGVTSSRRKPHRSH